MKATGISKENSLSLCLVFKRFCDSKEQHRGKNAWTSRAVLDVDLCQFCRHEEVQRSSGVGLVTGWHWKLHGYKPLSNSPLRNTAGQMFWSCPKPVILGNQENNKQVSYIHNTFGCNVGWQTSEKRARYRNRYIKQTPTGPQSEEEGTININITFFW